MRDLDSMKFYLRDNYLTINDLKMNFAGMVAMPEDDIETRSYFQIGTDFFQIIDFTDSCNLYDRF